MTVLAPEVVAANIYAARREAPLMFGMLWHSPRTSQRDSIRRLLEPKKLFAFLLGGNRSGKSHAGSQLLVALGLGREHIWTQAWCDLNGIPLWLIPSGPDTIWCVSGDSNDSRRIFRPKMAAFLGPKAEWRNRDGNGEAEATIATELGVAKWVFKSVDQGRDGFQGDAIRAAGFDEEPLDAEVVEETQWRVVDKAGRLFFFMTPLYGWTPLLGDKVRTVRSDTVVQRISGEDNPHQDQAALAMSLAATSAHLKGARAHGEITSAEGLVYPQWDRNVHVVPSFVPPREWKRYLSIDFGTRNPAAWMGAALDPKDDVLHLYREHYQAGLTVREHWTENRDYLAAERPMALADPEDLSARMELEQLGLKTQIADKDIRGGIDAMSERLALDANGKPHIVVHDCCVNFIREIEGYRWPKQRPGMTNDPREAPVKKDDHALDAVRYLAKHLHRRANPLERLKKKFPTTLLRTA